ncbi:enamine deaminase RidA (YjgF/YER057c/UK114 family) [Ulvibacter sp. MAR_2010_11]|uniref:RidA family protein n=1 Tax=Ulvibacter sp. MAR_2010_11 TaxID=1250229 RepID=UPI000C2CB10C|nr:RidA family protein [Ulvibacter sp. MAR_2010_11]PKA83132.1 enamine deaminase RidA (YjgF/YER057c/UK114 family) [Ulvibacter sp. MAR_2010_11]
MSLSIYKAAENKGVLLPVPPMAGGNYNPVQLRGNIGYVAIQFPIQETIFTHQGKLGQEFTTEDGYQAMRLCALNVLAQINEYVTMDRLEGINHITAYYRSAENWDEAPSIVNGASDLFKQILDTKGEHSRSLLGVHALPKNFSVGLTVTFTFQN